MSNSDLISVIIPVYKSEKYINRCVESIIKQTYKNIEIILVDDGSPDNCPQICDDWVKKDSRIKVIHKKNGGAFSARLEGVKNSSGEYIGFVDSDDWIDTDMYEFLLDLMQTHNADISAAGFRIVNEYEERAVGETEQTEAQISLYDFEGIIKNFQKNDLWSLCNKLYKRKLFDSLPELPMDLVFSEDMMMNYFLYKQINRIVISNTVKYNYYRHGDSAIAGVITYNIIDDSVKAYNIVDEDFDKSSTAYPYLLSLKVLNDMFLINSVIRNNKCLDRYEMLRRDILKNKKYVFSKKCANMFSLKHKIGVILLMIAPKLYNKTILIRRSVRGY